MNTIVVSKLEYDKANKYLEPDIFINYVKLLSKYKNHAPLTTDEMVELSNVTLYINSMYLNDQKNLSYVTELYPCNDVTTKLSISTDVTESADEDKPTNNKRTTEIKPKTSLCQKLYNSCCKGLGI